MSTDYNDLNEQVNAWAVELVSLDPTKSSSEEAVNLRVRIIDAMYEQLFVDKSKGQDIYGNELRYIPLLGKIGPVDVYSDVLLEILDVNKQHAWRYDIQKGTSFITFFKLALKKRVISYYYPNNKNSKKQDDSSADGIHENELYDDQNNYNIKKQWGITDFDYKKPLPILSGDGKIDEDSDTVLFDWIADPKADIERQIFSNLLIFAKILREYEERIDPIKGKHKPYYQSIFTFDTTKAIKDQKKDQKDFAATACDHDAELFPLMIVDLLMFLMVGCFTKMYDIVVNQLKPGINFKQRQKLLAKFLGISSPIMNKFSKKYDELRLSILGARGEKKFYNLEDQ